MRIGVVVIVGLIDTIFVSIEALIIGGFAGGTDEKVAWRWLTNLAGSWIDCFGSGRCTIACSKSKHSKSELEHRHICFSLSLTYLPVWSDGTTTGSIGLDSFNNSCKSLSEDWSKRSINKGK